MTKPLEFTGEYSPMAMLERAVRNAGRYQPQQERWTAVMDIFFYGSTVSHQLCLHFGLDPHELVGFVQEQEEEDEF